MIPSILKIQSSLLLLIDNNIDINNITFNTIVEYENTNIKVIILILFIGESIDLDELLNVVSEEKNYIKKLSSSRDKIGTNHIILSIE